MSSEGADGRRDGGSVCCAGGEHEIDSPPVGVLQGDGGGYGRRVRDDVVARAPQVGGKKRGRPPKTYSQTDVDRSDKKRSKRTTNKRLRWTATNREEFNRAQKHARVSANDVAVGVSGGVWQNVYGRYGEGGGVT